MFFLSPQPKIRHFTGFSLQILSSIEILKIYLKVH